ncbi:hypothetical protein BKI51_02475 [Alphaproteobacteria bacterium AO1-B]|nr:hypothetical protein BKI51_02475 [Alphaproteobacteria bacterium AO1-B]
MKNFINDITFPFVRKEMRMFTKQGRYSHEFVLQLLQKTADSDELKAISTLPLISRKPAITQQVRERIDGKKIGAKVRNVEAEYAS